MQQPVALLPHSTEAERAVLAACLLDPTSVATVGETLTAEDFYAERHQILWGAIQRLAEAGTTPDQRTLQAALEAEGRLEQVGGLAYLAGLDTDLPDLSRVESYVQIVRERSLRRRLVQLGTELARECLDGGVGAEEALARAERHLSTLSAEAGTSQGAVRLTGVLEELLDRMEEPGPLVAGLPTGLVDLDRLTLGLHPGELWIIGGRPGMGKTALALDIAHHLTLHGGAPVAYFSLEMSRDELALRQLAAESDVPYRRLRAGTLSQKHWDRIIQALRRLHAAELWIDDDGTLRLRDLVARARRLHRQAGIRALIVDHLQLMEGTRRDGNRNLELGEMSRALKRLAKELQIPVLALSQLSRAPDRSSDHRPRLADLRESGNLEQDADVVLFVYREEVYNRDNPDTQGLAELIVAKNRNGECTSIEAAFIGELVSFRNLARHRPGEPPF